MVFIIFMNYRYSELWLSYLHSILLTYLLTPSSSVLLEKLPSFQLVKKIPSLYGIRRFIIILTRARHL